MRTAASAADLDLPGKEQGNRGADICGPALQVRKRGNDSGAYEGKQVGIDHVCIHRAHAV